MVLPLLGILGAAAGLAGRQKFLNREAGQRGEYNSQVTAGVDQNDPNAMRQALFGGGLLTGSEVQGDVRTGFEGLEDRNAAMARQRVSSGPGYQQAALAAQKWASDPLNPNSEQFGQLTPYQQAQIEQQQYNRQFEMEQANTKNALAQAEFDLKAQAAQVPEVIAFDSQARGKPWTQVSPDVRSDIMSAEDRVSNLQDVVDYAQQTTAAGRAVSKAETAKYQTQFDLSVLPYMQSRFEAGAMQEAELELFERMSGDPFAWNQFTGAEQGKVTAILDLMKSDLRNQYRAYGLNDTTPEVTPKNLKPGLPQGSFEMDPEPLPPGYSGVQTPRID